eukprot:7202476-Ditylum_brightwellii.AAC.1
MEAMFDGFFHQDWTYSQDMHLWEKGLWTPRSNRTQWTDWITIWYPFFKKGIKDDQKQAIAG